MTASLADFHFLRPWWLLALVPCVLLALWFARRRHAPAAWSELIDPTLLAHLTVATAARLSHALPALLLGGWTLCVLALAGPTWERLPEAVERSQDALIIALELDASMWASDIAPSRLQRAQHKISDILSTRHDGLTALIVYAGDAHVVTPLSDDTATITAVLGALDPGIMPEPGNDPAAAAELASRLLHSAGLHQGRMLFIADAFPHASQPAVAHTLATANLAFSLLAIGTEQGAPVALPGSGGFLRDAHGGILVPRLDLGEMHDAARAASGRVAALGVDDSDIRYLLPEPTLASVHVSDTNRGRFDRWQDRAPWLALALLPLAALAFRRGWLLGLALLALQPAPNAEALEWHDLWLRKDQQAAQALADGDSQRAAELFRDPRWRASAQYRHGDYDAAARSWAGQDDATSHYNRGNALARAGRLDEAIAAYDAALSRDPQLADAQANRRLLENLKAQRDADESPGESGNEGKGNDDSENRSSDSDGATQDDSVPAPETSSGNSGDSPPEAADSQGSDDANGNDADKAGEESEPGNTESQDATSSADAPGQTPAGTNAEQSKATAGSGQVIDAPGDEEDQAMENWLRRIPDDPGELLRRKFEYESRKRQERDAGSRW